jgi:hypothetical protein
MIFASRVRESWRHFRTTASLAASLQFSMPKSQRMTNAENYGVLANGDADNANSSLGLGYWLFCGIEFNCLRCWLHQFGRFSAQRIASAQQLVAHPRRPRVRFLVRSASTSRSECGSTPRRSISRAASPFVSARRDSARCSVPIKSCPNVRAHSAAFVSWRTKETDARASSASSTVALCSVELSDAERWSLGRPVLQVDCPLAVPCTRTLDIPCVARLRYIARQCIPGHCEASHETQPRFAPRRP